MDDPHSVAARMTVDAEFAPLTSPICASCAASSKDGRRLVAVVGRAPVCRAMLYCSVQDDVSGRPIFDAAAPLLPGFAAPPAFVF